MGTSSPICAITQVSLRTISHQWYEFEEFEAYRHLGYLMGWAYLLGLQFNGSELVPAAACNAL